MNYYIKMTLVAITVTAILVAAVTHASAQALIDVTTGQTEEEDTYEI